MSRDNLNRVINELADAIATENANASIAFRDDVYNKGFYWAGKDYTKQFVMVSSPDRIFSSETIDIAKNTVTKTKLKGFFYLFPLGEEDKKDVQ